MAMRLQLEPWGRLPDLTRPAPPPRRERSSLAWAVPYWLAAVGFAYAVHADWFPVGAWMEALTASSGAGGPTYAASDLEASPLPPLIPDDERRRAAMGVFTESDGDDGDRWIPESDLEPVAAADDAESDEPSEPEDDQDERAGGDDEAEQAEPTADDDAEVVATRKGRTRARPTAEPRAEASAKPAPVAVAAVEDSPEPRGSRLDSRSRKLAMAVDRALGSSRGRPRAEEPVVESTPRLKRRSRRPSGKAMSCEAAIASYNEQWEMGGKKGPRDLSAEQYGAVLNGGGYFSHCGVPGSMGVKICAAVQNGQAVGVTVSTSPRSGKVSRCIANAVRGLGFPSHPRMDVTTTVFKPAR